MKNRLLLFLLSGMPVILSSQLTQAHNTPRQGDEIIKQQVQYVASGQPGTSLLWDFTSLQTINEAYTVTYTAAPLLQDSLYIMGYDQFEKTDKTPYGEELIVGTEHNTMYYYRLKGDSLLLLGHENPVVKLQYETPYALMTYPLNYGKTITGNYTTQGLYSGTEPIHTQGTTMTTADAYGKMILPGGDTLSPVVRIRTIQTIEDKLSPQNTIKQLETCRWYTKGYRYPVFETIRNLNLPDNTVLFATAFYYPLQDHFYIDTDPENQQIQDEMWTIKDDQDTNSHNEQTPNTLTHLIADYTIYPNPVSDKLYIRYELSEQAQVRISLYSVIDGTVYYQSKQQVQPLGEQQTSIDCHILPKGSYVLQIMTNNQVAVAQTVMKK